MSYYLLLCFILTLHMVGGTKITEETINDTDTESPAPPALTAPNEYSREPAESTWRTTVRTPSNSNTIKAKHGGQQDQLGQSAWWCNELYGIIALSSAGILLLVSIVLGAVSCFLRRRIKCSKLEDIRGHEMDTFGPRDAIGSGTFFPLQEQPPSANNGGVTDVENCPPDSELPKTETPQSIEDQTANEAAANFPPPEDLPMLS